MPFDDTDRITCAAAFVADFSPSATTARRPGAGLPFRLEIHDTGRLSKASRTIAIKLRPSCRSLASRSSPPGALHIRPRTCREPAGRAEDEGSNAGSPLSHQKRGA